jgi:hypothetical protein
LARQLTIGAIERYHEAIEARADAYRQFGDAERLMGYDNEETRDDANFDEICRWENWTNLAEGLLIDARRHLIAAIVTWNDEADRAGNKFNAAHKFVWEPRGFAHDGKLYIASPVSGCDAPIGEGDKGGSDLMDIIVLDMTAVEGLR